MVALNKKALTAFRQWELRDQTKLWNTKLFERIIYSFTIWLNTSNDV